jgi:hypothetical protein
MSMNDLRRQLPKLLRLLSSDNDGEVLAAARAISRLLNSVEADFHDLAAVYENDGIAEQRFARANITLLDPTGERALDHWRVTLKSVGFCLEDSNFPKLPQAWQQFARTLAQSAPYVLSDDEEVMFDRIRTRLNNWKEKQRREALERKWQDHQRRQAK